MIEKRLVKELIKKGLTISLAESCTGGEVTSQIVSVDGASNILETSFITYSSESKEKFIGVPKDVIENCGVVSREVAEQMAICVATTCESDVGVGITGYAGPTGGTREKPVGTVCFGFFVKGKTYSYQEFFEGTRNKIRKQATNFALESLYRIIAYEL